MTPHQPRLRYLSVCSGIEAATVAWHPLGFEAAAFSEIDKFASAVLAYRWPGVPNLGDFTSIRGDDVGAIDILVGGTPCQSFSIAGLRDGLADDRGNLALQFLKLAERTRPRWVVWENVPGVLSSNGGRDFGAILGGMVECGYGFAYRVLDAQFFGLAQRRKRVFVVGHLGDWRRSAAVLFERESLSGDIAPSREAREGVAGTLSSRSSAGGGLGTDFDISGGMQVARCLNAHPSRIDLESETFVRVAKTLRAQPNAAHRADSDTYVTGVIQSVQAVRDKKQNGIGIGDPEGAMFTLTKRDQHAIAYRTTGNDGCYETGDHIGALGVGTDPNHHVIASAQADVAGFTQRGEGVRRLTPTECERLQGFPDGYTAVPYRGSPASDGPRYRALGNSMAVPVMHWIGRRIQQVEALH